MSWLRPFKKRRQDGVIKSGGANYIAAHIEAMQRKAAGYLNARTANWTTMQIKIGLVCFCLVAGGNSIYILAKAIERGNGPPKKSICGPPPQKANSNSFLNNHNNRNNDNKTNR